MGKNIVIYLLNPITFKFEIWGNVPPEKFVETSTEVGARVVGISVCRLSLAGELKVIDLLEKWARNRLKL